MEIQCECGKFRAELAQFPKHTPGRLKCYCDDCQVYLHYIQRPDLLDANGGTEIIPVYPSDIRVLQGQEFLKCTRLSPRGLFRFSTTCCNTPITNTDGKRPWAGLHRRLFTVKDPQKLDQFFPKIKSTILGKYAHGTLPPGTPQTFDLKGFCIVMPFLIKGIILGRAKPSAFFKGAIPVGPVTVVTKEEREQIRKAAGIPSGLPPHRDSN